MATVYRAYAPRFGRDVAIKVLPPEFLHDPDFRARFEREAHIIAALEHPGIVPVYDFGEEAGLPYLVMRYMVGGSLADRLARVPLAPLETARILAAIAPALDMAHARGVIHRDLKPGNILLDEHDNPYIADFGIAKLVEGSAAFTSSGIMGTPTYMSPEQAQGNVALDGRSDVYALGAMLYELLAGQPPYKADTPLSLAMAHVLNPVPHVQEAVPSLSVEVDRVVSRAMAKEREQRYATAGALATALTAAAQGMVQPATRHAAPAAVRQASQRPTPPSPGQLSPRPPLPPSASAQRPSSRRKAWPVWIVSLAVMVMLLVTIAILSVNWNRNPKTLTTPTVVVIAPPSDTPVVAAQPSRKPLRQRRPTHQRRARRQPTHQPLRLLRSQRRHAKTHRPPRPNQRRHRCRQLLPHHDLPSRQCLWNGFLSQMAVSRWEVPKAKYSRRWRSGM